ncbi:MAG: diacylglycerol kinase family lipid kinase [Acidobacteria bacterium]|nr:diacylglycerol kinase family lipid kinase [Acidobacteriota bacterium]
MRVLLIVNPSSGRGKTKKLLPQLKELLANHSVHSLEYVESRSQDDLVELAASATKDGYDVVTAVGGDGTIHYVLTGIVKTLIQEKNNKKTALGIIPLGRGNDIARTLKIPTDPKTACEILLAGKRQLTDVAYTGKNFYIGVAGVGFDSEATKLANETKLKGGWLPAVFVYGYSVLRALIRYKAKKVKITYDGGIYEGKIMLAAISNGQAYGGGMFITPIAEVNDGLLDICILKEMSKIKLIINFPKVLRGTHLGHPYIEYIRTKKAEVESIENTLELYGDGEYLEETPLKIEILKHCLPVIIP